MKASELIKLIEESIENHGDLPIKYFDVEWCEFSNVEDVTFAKDEEYLVLKLEE